MMENACVEQFISSLAESLKLGYAEFINSFNFSDRRKKIDSLINRCDVKTTSKNLIVSMLLLSFQRQASLAVKGNGASEKEIKIH